MSPWMEILINLTGYAGFIGVAICHKPHRHDEVCRIGSGERESRRPA